MQIARSLRRLFGWSSRISDAPFVNRPIENAELARAEYREGETIVRSLPSIVLFAHSTRCNFRQPCLPCDRHTRPPEAESDTTQAVIHAVTPLLRTAQHAVLFAGGEPLFSKWFDQVIGLIEPPTRAIFYTNGSLLTKRKTDLILDRDIMGPISVSLDAATPETYRIMRPSSDFQNVIRNVTSYTERAQVMVHWESQTIEGARNPFLRASMECMRN